MQLSIELRQYDWVDGECLGVGGYFSSNGSFKHASQFNATDDDAVENLRHQMGFFSLISHQEDQLVAAVDHVRSMPLFYAVTEDALYLSDDAQYIHNQIDASEDSFYRTEYLLFGYTLGSNTRSSVVRQLRPGEVLIGDFEADEPEVSIERYFNHEYVSPDTFDEEQLLNRFDSVMRSSFERLIEYANGRTIAVSLTGGYDSRICLALLRDLGYENLIAFTFGSADDPDVIRAEQIANALDVDWHFIEYTHELLYDWFRSNERRELEQLCGTLDSVPGGYSAPALEMLRNQSELPMESVIVNGDGIHATQSHAPKWLFETKPSGDKELIDVILDKRVRWDSRYHLRSDEYKNRLDERVLSVIDSRVPSSSEELVNLFEQWGWLERQSKFILRNYVYEYYGYDWWMPLWDKEIMAFWQKTPSKYRFDKSLHKKYAKQCYVDVSNQTERQSLETFPNKKPSDMKDRLERFIRTTPVIHPIIKFLYFRSIKSPRKYDDDPKFGIMNEDMFNQLVLGDDYVHGYRVLDTLGYISIEDGQIYDFPNEYVHVPRWN